MSELPDLKSAAMALRALKEEGEADGLDELSGWRRVATLLVSFGEELAAEMMQHLDDDEVEQITRVIADLKSVPREQQRQVVAEFEAKLSSGALPAAGGEQFVRDMLESAFGTDRAQQMLERMGRRKTSAFKLLDGADPAQVAPFIAQQHPQTIALILSQLKPDKAAGLLDLMPTTLQSDVAHRIATLEQVSPEVLNALEETLVEELSDALSGQQSVDGTKVAAEILNRVGSSLERNVLDRLDAQDPEVAAQIRDEMFVFDDIARLDSREIDVVLQNADHKELVVALKAAGKGVLDRVLGAMSERRQQLLLDDLAALPPMRLSEVEQGQLRIVHQMRALEEQGLIRLARGDTDDEYV